ncbi:retropepsin-like aspartic protease family protein [Sphingomonas sp. DT-204]|uniref:retropepsin-like aspartic protease family protein n=1 Tax=Sphingomonas sp. DT-204 TaxID=3396166 RepID=UPI003F1CFC76
MSLDSANYIWALGALVLAVSALMAQRASLGTIVRSLIAWGAIIGLIAIALMYRQQIETVVTAAAERLGLGDQEVVGDTVRITMSEDGHFWARVTLNDHTKRMLVDSGATITALSEETARNAGIKVGGGGFPVVINTANGSVTAERGRAERVSVGGLETHDLGVVVSPAFGSTDVLGMNFLSRLGSWRVEGRTLVLEPKRDRNGR